MSLLKHPTILVFLFGILLSNSCSKELDPYKAFEQGDYETAYQSLLPLAKAGDLEAQNYIGVIHYLGLGKKRDLKAAKSWFEKAATKGYPGAQYNLGNMYENGEVVEQDFIQSYMWFYAAKEQGHAKARSRMKYLLEDHKLFPSQADTAVQNAVPYIINRKKLEETNSYKDTYTKPEI